MPTRFRWYRLRIPNDNNRLISVIMEHPLINDQDFGFVYVDDSKFRFLWRTKITVTRLDDSGETLFEEVETINVTSFSIVYVASDVFLRIENPGRTIRELLNALEILLGFGFTAKPLTFEHSKPTSIFEFIKVTKLVGLKIVGAVVGTDLVSRMEFASKQGMIVEDISILSNLDYKIDSAIYELVYSGIKGQMSFSSNGIVKVSGQLAPKIIHLIEVDLPYLN